MKAIVKYGQRDGEVELREVPEPTCGDGEVLLETRAVGVCGSDIEMWRHQVTFTVNTPVIQGHEFCGVIREVGPGVTGYQPGDRVTSETAAYICGRCRYCRTGEYNLCPERLGFGYGTDGAFTRWVRVPERCLHRIPEAVPFEHAALTEPACVAYNAVAVKSRVRPGEPLLVIGPGPIGLFAVQVARTLGASPIILVGTRADPQRLAVGSQVGAEVIVNKDEQEPLAVVQEIIGDEGIPLVVDAAGNNEALKLAIEAVARSGQITKIGWGPPPVNLSLDPLISKAVTLQGVFSHTWRTWEAVLQMMAGGIWQMDSMITHRFTIADWETAYHLAEEREAVKVVLTPLD